KSIRRMKTGHARYLRFQGLSPLAIDRRPCGASRIIPGMKTGNVRYFGFQGLSPLAIDRRPLGASRIISERRTMTELSDEKNRERAERARRNGCQSRGPSAAGAAGSKLGGLDGGLRAQTYPLPGEHDADAAAQAEWIAVYRPRSPAAVYHAKQCARATVIADRCARFASARIADQKRRAIRNFQSRGPRRGERGMVRVHPRRA